MMLVLLLLLAVAAAIAATSKQLGGLGTHFVVLQSDGQVYGVGSDAFGQLGVNTTSSSFAYANQPVRMLHVRNASDVSAGETHSCVVDEDAARCVGDNQFGQLGSDDVRATGLLVSGLPAASSYRVSQVFCGVRTTCAIMLESEEAWCWGANERGGLGRGGPVSRVAAAPVLLPAQDARVMDVGMGLLHTCWLSARGRVLCAGLNSDSQLGDGREEDSAVPVAVADVHAGGRVVYNSLACGAFHCCAASSNSAGVYCWGANYAQQLGGVMSVAAVPTLAMLLPATSTGRVWAGDASSFVLGADGGTVWAFGRFTGGSEEAAEGRRIILSGGGQVVQEVRGGAETTCVLFRGGGGAVSCIGASLGGGGISGGSEEEGWVPLMGLPSAPTKAPTQLAGGTRRPTRPTSKPTKAPTRKPTKAPSGRPTSTTAAPSAAASTTVMPTVTPTSSPTSSPSVSPSASPTSSPSTSPTSSPSASPTSSPTTLP